VTAPHRLAALLALALPLGAIAQPVPPLSIDPLPCGVFAVSDDGRTVLGNSTNVGGRVHACLWNVDEGQTTVDIGPTGSTVAFLSGNGQAIWGYQPGEVGAPPRVFRWTESAGVELMPPHPPISSFDYDFWTAGSGGQIADVSFDGSFTVGNLVVCGFPGFNECQVRPAIWTVAAIQQQAIPEEWASTGVMRGSLAENDTKFRLGPMGFGSGDIPEHAYGPFGGPYMPHPATTVSGFFGVEIFCADGATAFGDDSSSRTTRWQAGESARTIGTHSFFFPLAASATGDVLVGTYRPNPAVGGVVAPFIWTEDAPGGFQELLPYFESVGFPLPYDQFFLQALSADGSSIFGTGSSSGGSVTVRIGPAADVDGDGLLDAWEREGGGIDSDGDGEIDLSLFELGARPDRKDIFLEIDATVDMIASPGMRSLLLAAFDAAPVSNPDGTTGIALHIDATEFGIDAPAIVPFEGQPWPPLFDVLKQANFGTNEDRANPKRLAAKRKFVRYCLLFDRTDGTEGGMAEKVHCDDFFANLGYARDIFFADQDAMDLDGALIVMHELGHALGLGHGGGDDINGKPNYPSIMNYCLAHVAPFNEEFLLLDFCAVQLPTLFENNLDETIGIGGDPLYHGFRMPVGFSQPSSIGGPPVRLARTVPLDGSPQDLGSPSTPFRDEIIGQGVQQDINWLASGPGSFSFASTESPGQTLNGYNDWANLRYALPASAAKGADEERNPPAEPGYLELREFLLSIPRQDPSPEVWMLR